MFIAQAGRTMWPLLIFHLPFITLNKIRLDGSCLPLTTTNSNISTISIHWKRRRSLHFEISIPFDRFPFGVYRTKEEKKIIKNQQASKRLNVVPFSLVFVKLKLLFGYIFLCCSSLMLSIRSPFVCIKPSSEFLFMLSHISRVRVCVCVRHECMDMRIYFKFKFAEIADCVSRSDDDDDNDDDRSNASCLLNNLFKLTIQMINNNNTYIRHRTKADIYYIHNNIIYANLWVCVCLCTEMSEPVVGANTMQSDRNRDGEKEYRKCLHN